MGGIRQNKIENIIQEEIAKVFQQNARELCLGAMVTPTVVRITPDLSLARVFLSIFAGPPKEEVLQHIVENKGKIRGEIGRRLKNMRHIPDLDFKIDDSLDYAMKIEELLKK
ncbi:MAG: 30S ribosome-binding factor RbfA [Brumimicrobium sp.]|nr:30S ribosome-binding factor RbfA [Brumimicrobium sp.]